MNKAHVGCCSSADGYGGGQRHEMTVREYVEWWRSDRIDSSGFPQLLYLKDWHCVNEFPDYKARQQADRMCGTCAASCLAPWT